MTPNESILASIMAATDALWLPCRDAMGHVWPLTHIERRAYPTDGVVWRHGGGSMRERQANHRAMVAVSSAGWSRVLPAGNTRAVRVLLTDAGEAHGRALVGSPSLAESLAEVHRLARLAPIGTWVSETVMVGKNYDAPDVKRLLVRQEERLVPALARGWVESRSTVQRQVAYRVTDAGAEARMPDGYPGADDLPAWDEAAADAYNDALFDALAALAVGDPGAEIGPIPLHAGEIMWKAAKRRARA